MGSSCSKSLKGDSCPTSCNKYSARSCSSPSCNACHSYTTPETCSVCHSYTTPETCSVCHSYRTPETCSVCHSYQAPATCDGYKCGAGTRPIGIDGAALCAYCDSGSEYTELNNTNTTCYKKCSPGYKMTAGTCYGDTLPITDTTPATCPSGMELIGGFCYNECPSDKERVPGAPTQCVPKTHGLTYRIDTSVPITRSKYSYEAGCHSNREKAESLCYHKCSDVYDECYITEPGAPTFCIPKRGELTYRPKFLTCPDGYNFNGVTSCENTYVPKTYAKKLIKGKCPNGDVNINGLCYKDCPTIDVNVNGNTTKIKLQHIPGLPGQCAPPHNGGFYASYAAEGAPFVVPMFYPKIRKVAFSSAPHDH